MKKPNKWGIFLIAFGLTELVYLFRAENLFQRILIIGFCCFLVISGIVVIVKDESKK